MPGESRERSSSKISIAELKGEGHSDVQPPLSWAAKGTVTKRLTDDCEDSTSKEKERINGDRTIRNRVLPLE
ncbi:hypothetical protein PROFUN_16214 [Planoprotostelium fungivorum]|uniref:Uncharacterized protein n=1 Tax=Planoprotostelium fungivorum TaxID=1890364 RepID=A0A2P6MNM0_9EUKA|nr:hypothetical protein PROFUN_16214 [Planoprotostelium fungivorum]